MFGAVGGDDVCLALIKGFVVVVVVRVVVRLVEWQLKITTNK